MSTEDAALQRLLDEGAGVESASTPYGPEPDQLLEEYGPADAPTFVLVHGGYFRPAVDRTHARPMSIALARAGWYVVLAEYRRIPGNPIATIDDLTLLDAWLRDTGHDVAAWVGHSAGGALVLWRALTPDLPPARVVALAPVADFDGAIVEHLGHDAVADWLGGATSGRPGAPSSHLDALDPTRLRASNPAAAQRITVLHGTDDQAVPLRQSEGWSRTVLEGAHHFDLVDPASPHWPAVLAALRDTAPAT